MLSIPSQLAPVAQCNFRHPPRINCVPGFFFLFSSIARLFFFHSSATRSGRCLTHTGVVTFHLFFFLLLSLSLFLADCLFVYLLL